MADVRALNLYASSNAAVVASIHARLLNGRCSAMAITPQPFTGCNPLSPWEGKGGRKVGWYEPPHLIYGQRAFEAIGFLLHVAAEGQWAGEGGSCLELPSSAVVKNSPMMIRQRLVTEKVTSA